MPQCKTCPNKLGCGQCRGLCEKCYSRLKYAVQRGKTTWEKAEAKGLIDPVKAVFFSSRERAKEEARHACSQS